MENKDGAPYMSEKGEVIRIKHGLGKAWRQCSLYNQSASFLMGLCAIPEKML